MSQIGRCDWTAWVRFDVLWQTWAPGVLSGGAPAEYSQLSRPVWRSKVLSLTCRALP